MQPGEVQENRRCRPCWRDHREAPIVAPEPVVEIDKSTERGGVDEADEAQVDDDCLRLWGRER